MTYTEQVFGSQAGFQIAFSAAMIANSNRGAALILAVMILSLLSILGGALLTSTTLDIWIGDNYKTRTQALYLAEAGVEQAREELLQSATSLSGLLANASGIDGVLSTAHDLRTLRASDDQPLLSATFIEGNYTIWLRNDVVDDFASTADTNGVVTIVSVGQARGSISTIEATIRKGRFPDVPFSYPPLSSELDPQLKDVAALERLVAAITRNADQVVTPAPGSSIVLGNVGGPTDYRIVVVNGDCTLAGGTGYGFLLVRGSLTMANGFSWMGFIAAVGQGVIQWPAVVHGDLTGGLFAAQTRDAAGTLLPTPGIPLVDLTGASGGWLRWDAIAIGKANSKFPYGVIARREY
jgi:Tfp pilus assembly protein PilX